MKQLIQKYLRPIINLISVFPDKLKTGSFVLLSGLFSFCLVFGGIYITSSRNMAIKKIRWEMQQNISRLNEIGLDVAYDKIEFNSLFFSPLVQINNFQIYNLHGINSWSVKFNSIEAYPNIFGDSKIRFESTDGGVFSFNDFTSSMSSKRTFLDIESKNQQLDELVFHAEDINIKDFAKIEKIAFLLQSVKNKNHNKAITIPSYESFFEINSVNINGLLNYPLSSQLKLFYAKSNIIGRPSSDKSLLTSMETWLKDGGFIEVPNLIVQWEPLTLVGRGSVNFNETFSPRINFNTSSKGLLRLIKDLQENEFLDSKNVFVANIMLSNKAFKINPDDQELTISTPISYADGKITIENLTIKDFSK